ncbi:MAG: CBS domain-containing protein [Clostridiales bacterium]|jgi:CBS domain-containing protein|nr:CBS domain-containing protein [Bacillota bacterium]NLK04087.1 CBS domain-containing protein [Clostridiales bacterium]
MNIAYFLKTKAEVSYLMEDFTLRQGLEKMRNHGHTAIPVLSRDDKYIGTISEGDFLWFLIDDRRDQLHKTNMKSIEDIKIKDIFKKGKNPSVRITATMDEMMMRAMDQNFIPVVDDRDYFIGIITRKDIMRYINSKLKEDSDLLEDEFVN